MTTTPPAGQTTAVAKNPLVTFRDLLEKMKPQLALAMPKHVDPDRMVRIIFTSVRRNPDLLNCTQTSLIDCIIQCTQLGLEFGGPLGHAYPVPFKNTKENRIDCQLIIGYKGLLKLARQSGEISSVSARVVNEKDLFEYEYGLNEKLRHIPYMITGPKDDPGRPLFAYAIFKFKDGGYHFDVMSVQEIEWIREKSKSGNSPAWRDHWDEMAKKTVIRRASKMSPASIEDKMAHAIALDEAADAGLPQQIDGGDLYAIEPTPSHAGELGEAPPKEGIRGPMRRPAKTEKTAADKAAEAPPAREPGADDGDPDAADKKAAEPTAAEIAAAEAAGVISKGPGAAKAAEEEAPWDKK